MQSFVSQCGEVLGANVSKQVARGTASRAKIGVIRAIGDVDCYASY